MASTNSNFDKSNTETLKRSYSERNWDSDGLKRREVQLLRRQNSESSRQGIEEKECYRNQHLVTMSQLEAVADETSAMRNKYSEIVPDKQRMDRNLRSSCCSQSDIKGKESGSLETFNKRYFVSVNEYEALKQDYDSLRQQYDDFLSPRNNAADKLDFKQEEIDSLKQQLEEMIVEHNNVILERNGLQQQCTQAVHKWDMTLRERKDLQDALKKMQQQFEEAMSARVKICKDIKRLTEERDAAMQEYSLIMSERDSVHKEMEKLSDDLSQAIKKNKIFENQIKEHVEQKKALSYHVETLKREIASALSDRDKALKECDDFRQKFGEYTAKEDSHREAFKSIFDYSYVRERDFNCEDLNEMQSTPMDLFSKCQKGSMPDLDQANQEIERLRKCIDTQKIEVQEALQEGEVSKRRRDWAFAERDKIVLQRETLKTMYEQLRKERDRDKINLAEALRDSDELDRQLEEAKKELQAMKEKIEIDKGNRLLHLNTTGHSYSHDSAIDSDLQEWDTEIFNINLDALSTIEDIGVELAGGRDDPYYPNDSGIYVSSICRGSVLEGKLKVNDCILRVNNLDCHNASRKMLTDAIYSSAGNCNILIKRRRIGARSLFTTQLQLNNYDHGLQLETGVYICKITPGSLAAKEGNLAVGDRVLTINNKPMDGLKNVQDAMAILNEPTDILVITTLRSTHCSNNCGDGSNRDMYKKYTNSSTQTEQRSNLMNHPYDMRENRQPHPITCEPEIRAVAPNLNEWDTILQTKDLMRGHRYLEGDKKSIHELMPVTFDQERDDAIAELDSVIDSYHSKHSNRQQLKEYGNKQLLPPQKVQKRKTVDKNGGTWPKTRLGQILSHPTGTILHVRKKRDRLPLSAFLNQTSNCSAPQTCCTKVCPEDVRSSTSKDPSLDFSVKSGNIGKDVLEFYKAKKNSSKYPVTDLVDSHDRTPHSRARSQIYSPCTLTKFMRMETHHRQHLADSRYSSSNMQSSQSGDSLSLIEPGAYFFEPSYNTMDQLHHEHSPSIDSTYQKAVQTIGTSRSHPHRGEIFCSDSVPRGYYRYEGGTFPRKKENERLRIPSNPGVAVAVENSVRVSASKGEKSSERDSPMPTFHVDVLNQRQSKRNSLPCWSYKPSLGQERRVTIENPVEPLGITIQCLENGAVFVSGVTEHSLASQVGLQVGDQLLEVCGINMRNASYKWAEAVLGQCGNNNNMITLHVQYNPHKYTAASCSDGSVTSGDDESRSDLHSGSPTPCNSPKASRKSTPSSLLNYSSLYARTITTLTRPKPSEKTGVPSETSTSEPRLLVLETRKCSNLGISLVGGNAVGIYVHSVTPHSLAFDAGLRTGDHILEYNGTDLRQATAEEAAFELAKPTDKVTVLVRSEIERYNQIKDQPGDSFYIRALFDRTGDLGDRNQLQFCKDDILYVDNTMLNGKPGNWRASVINQRSGQTQQWGIIPSKYKIEEELLKRSLSDLEGDARRGMRRSFFRRKKTRNDSKELASFSNFSPDWFNDSGSLNEETALASYQKVIRLDSEPMLRPVLIVGPLAECVTEKLLADYPDKFNRCIPEIRYATQAVMEKCLTDNIFIDYRKKGNAFECISIASLKESINQRCHCIMDINLASVRRLQNHHIYPIVLLIKFKSTKQIKEVKDTRYLSDKTSAKAAKEMYEHALKLESEYRQDISAVIPAGVNVAFMCTQIKAAVDQEQNKTIWVPSPAT